MTKLKKPAGAYLIGVAVIVAAFFITNPLLAELIDPTKVWATLEHSDAHRPDDGPRVQLCRQEDPGKGSRNRTTP